MKPNRNLPFWRLYEHLRKSHRVSVAVLSGCRTMDDLRAVHATALSCTTWKEKPNG